MPRPLRTLALALALCGCVGHLEDSAAGPRGAPRPGVDPARVATTPRRLVLLSPRHYANAVTELLELAPGDVDLPTSGGASVDGLFAGGTDRVTPALAFELQQIAEDAAARATASLDPASDCEGVAEDSCAETRINALTRRAFRRTPTTDELRALTTIYTTGRDTEGSFAGGMRWAIEALLQSPSFLYRRELGQRVTDSAYSLDGFEMATALGFFLRDAGPDAALLDAAARGELDDDEGLTLAIDRLLEDPEVRTRITAMMLRWLELARLESAVRSDPALTDELRASMRDETTRFVDEVLWERSASIAELLTSPRAFVDERLAAHYGVDYPDGSTGMVAMELPGDRRAGILTHGSWLTMHADVADTSVVHRGLFVARQLLCTSIAPPPAGVIEMAQDDLAALHTERERAEYRMDSAVCGSCHAHIDPFGLAFEQYDELGRHRADHDASSTLVAPSGVAGSIDGAIELAERLAGADEVGPCIALQLGGAALGRSLERDEIDAFAPVIRELDVSGGNLVTLVRAIARWPGMRLRRESL